MKQWIQLSGEQRLVFRCECGDCMIAGEEVYLDPAGMTAASMECSECHCDLHYQRTEVVQSTGHVFTQPLGGKPTCSKCGCDEDDAYVGGQLCIDEEEGES